MSSSKVKKISKRDIKETVSKMVEGKEYEKKREDETFSSRLKSGLKEKSVIILNYNL